jgi:hypothetical protein
VKPCPKKLVNTMVLIVDRLEELLGEISNDQKYEIYTLLMSAMIGTLFQRVAEQVRFAKTCGEEFEEMLEGWEKAAKSDDESDDWRHPEAHR